MKFYEYLFRSLVSSTMQVYRRRFFFEKSPSSTPSGVEANFLHSFQDPIIEQVEYTIYDKNKDTTLTGCLEIEVHFQRLRENFLVPQLEKITCDPLRRKFQQGYKHSQYWTPFVSSFPGIYSLTFRKDSSSQVF